MRNPTLGADSSMHRLSTRSIWPGAPLVLANGRHLPYTGR